MTAMDEATRETLKQTAGILASFLPLFAFAGITFGRSSLLRLQIGIYVGCALLIGMMVTRLVRGALLWALAVFFVFALVSAAWLKNMWVIRHLAVFPSGLLFSAAMLSMILGRPFVQDYARETTPVEQQESVLFVRSCFVLTSFWAAVFLVMALLSVVQTTHPADKGIYVLAQLALLLAALSLQVLYIVRVKRKRAALGE